MTAAEAFEKANARIDKRKELEEQNQNAMDAENDVRNDAEIMAMEQGLQTQPKKQPPAKPVMANPLPATPTVLTKKGKTAQMTTAQAQAENAARDARNTAALNSAMTNPYMSKLEMGKPNPLQLDNSNALADLAKVRAEETAADRQKAMANAQRGFDQELQGNVGQKKSGTPNEVWLKTGKGGPAVSEKPKEEIYDNEDNLQTQTIVPDRSKPKDDTVKDGGEKFDIGAALAGILGDLGGIMSQRNHNFAGTPEAGAIVMQNRFNQQKDMQAREQAQQLELQKRAQELEKQMPGIGAEAAIKQFQGTTDYSIDTMPRYWQNAMRYMLPYQQAIMAAQLGMFGGSVIPGQGYIPGGPNAAAVSGINPLNTLTGQAGDPSSTDYREQQWKGFPSQVAASQINKMTPSPVKPK